jgi:glucose-6-phosphate isomerase
LSVENPGRKNRKSCTEEALLMQNPLMPMLSQIDLEHGTIKDAAEVIVRRLSDMQGHYHDQKAVRDLLQEDPVLYRVYLTTPSDHEFRWRTAMSVIEPGKVGAEYYMTKGHFHKDPQAPEVYLTLLGEGKILLQTHDGRAEVQSMLPGTMNYIPGDWAHRTINTGDTPLAFFAVWPADAGHDYAGVIDQGFTLLVLEENGRPVVVPNPHHEGS